MGIQKPYNVSLNGKTIDGSEINIVSWKSSGDISVAFEVYIYKNSDGSLVYDSGKISSYAQQYGIPAHSTTNGLEYKVQISIFNNVGSIATSDAVIFQTSSRPIVTLDTISSPVASQNYQFSATYSQAENVPMQSYVTYLYDNTSNLLAQSNVLTTTPIEYRFSGLESGDSYYIEFQATSTKGLTGTTGKIQFSVQYERPTMNVILSGSNEPDTSAVSLSWNVIQIIGQTDVGVFQAGEKIDVTIGKAWFNDGFSVDGDFTLKVWFDSPIHNKDLLTLTGLNGQIKLQYQDDNKFHLTKTNNGSPLTSRWASSVLNGTSYFVYIQQVGDNMSVGGEVLTGTDPLLVTTLSNTGTSSTSTV